MYRPVLILFCCILALSCVEEVELPIGSVNTFENILIVEGTLTDEMKNHQINLSRIDTISDLQRDSVYNPFFQLNEVERDLVTYEENAQVSIIDGFGNQYEFNEVRPGTYISLETFAAEKDVTYSLQITTQSGTSYSSPQQSFNTTAQIDNVYAERGFNVDNNEGVFIYLDASGTDDNSKYYRYTYEETYKIIAPAWRDTDFVLENYEPCALPVITYDLSFRERENEEGRICYRTDFSNTINQNSTVGLDDNSATRLPIRFINRNNYIISHRYSILIKQYAQSLEAFEFYQRLNSFSSSENVFSAIQPGFLKGNITANGNNSSVIGFFEVASVSKRRIYFNYEDLFPLEPLPDYAINCTPFSPPLEHPSYCFTGPLMWPCPFSIVEGVNVNLFTYYGENELGIGACPGPYLVTYRGCGDCTVLGESAVPDFWEE